MKIDPATGDIAMRTRLPEEGSFAGMAWLIVSSVGGARNASTAELAAWIDIPRNLIASLIEGGAPQ